MKKDNKAAQRRAAETIGVDLGDKVSHYAILNEEGRIVEEGHFRNNEESIAKHFGKIGKARVALEVGARSAWIAREFSKLGHEVIVANARELKWITASDTKNDRNDAVKLLTLGRKERFVHSRDVGSFLGLRPRQQQSGERNPQLGISKSGDKYLRKLLVQCAHHILGHWGKDSALRQWGLSKSDGSVAKKRAVIAVARKLAVVLHRMWMTGESFKPFPKMT